MVVKRNIFYLFISLSLNGKQPQNWNTSDLCGSRLTSSCVLVVLDRKKIPSPEISIKECMESWYDLKEKKTTQILKSPDGEEMFALEVDATFQSHVTSGGASNRTPAFCLPGLYSPREMWTTHIFRLLVNSLKLLSSSLRKCRRKLIERIHFSSLCQFLCLSPFCSSSSCLAKKSKTALYFLLIKRAKRTSSSFV